MNRASHTRKKKSTRLMFLLQMNNMLRRREEAAVVWLGFSVYYLGFVPVGNQISSYDYCQCSMRMAESCEVFWQISPQEVDIVHHPVQFGICACFTFSCVKTVRQKSKKTFTININTLIVNESRSERSFFILTWWHWWDTSLFCLGLSIPWSQKRGVSSSCISDSIHDELCDKVQYH